MKYYDVYTLEEEKIAFEKLKEAKKNNNMKKYYEIRNDIVLHNMKLVNFLAKKFGKSTIDINDLINEGVLGLIDAVDNYDNGYDNKFISYAYYYVKKSIIFKVKTSSIIYVPMHVINSIGEIKRQIDLYSKSNDYRSLSLKEKNTIYNRVAKKSLIFRGIKNPTKEQIKTEADLYYKAIKYYDDNNIIYLDECVKNRDNLDKRSYGDIIYDDEFDMLFDKIEFGDALKRVLKKCKLTLKQKFVLILCFNVKFDNCISFNEFIEIADYCKLINFTGDKEYDNKLLMKLYKKYSKNNNKYLLGEIARELGVSVEDVSQTCKRALTRARRDVKKKNLTYIGILDGRKNNCRW